MDNVGKMRNVRNHQPHRPYDRRGGKSLLGRVSDSVKEMLSPSWLVDLVQSVKKKTPPASQPSCSEASRSTDPMQRQMAAGGVQYPHLNRGTNLSQSFPGTQQENGLPSGIPHGHEPLQMSPGNLAFPSPLGQLDLSTNSLLVNGGDEHAELNDYSLAGSCNMRGSMVANKFEADHLASKEGSRIQQMRQEYGGSVTPSKEIEERAHTLNTFQDSGQHQMNDRSFLWSGEVKNESYHSPQPPAKRHKPSFNLSLFGASTSSAQINESSSFHESSFYPGKTTFGGASSHKKSRAKASPRVLTPTRKQVQAKPLNQSPGGVTSSTARKILDSLERMSTPLSDVKKIPSYNSSLADSPLSFSGPPVKGLSSPGQVRLAKNLQKPAQESSLHRMAMNKAAKPNEQLGSSSLGIDEASKVGPVLRYQPVTGTQEKPDTTRVNLGEKLADAEPVKARSGKMKRERNTHHVSRKGQEEEEEQAEVPNLSTGFTLPVSNIDLNLPALARPPLHSPTSAQANQKASSTNSQMSESISAKSEVKKQEFTFSSPISQDAPTEGSSVSPQPQPFKFRSPLKVDQNDNKTATTSSVSAPSTDIAMQFSQASAPLKKKVVEPVVETPVADSGGGGGFKPAEKLKTGSVMDFLKKSEVKTTVPPPPTYAESKPASLGNLFKKVSGSWDCPMCMVNNKPEQNKCPCCETPKPSSTETKAVPPSGQTIASTSNVTSTAKPPLNSLFSKPSNKWECPTCMVSNDNSLSKCPCCETAKPQAKDESKSAPSTQMASHKPPISSLFKIEKDTWECPTCMIRNKDSAPKCIACETRNPNPPKTTAPSQSGFLKFKKPAGSWECDTCMVTNKEDSTKCIACEAPKPGLKTTSSFTSAGGFKFGTGFKVGDKVDSASTGGFKMPSATGMTNSLANSGLKPAEQKSGEPFTGGFKFGAPVKTDTVNGDPPTGGFKFGIPLKKDSTDEKSTSEKTGFSLGIKPNNSSTTSTSEKETSSGVESSQNSEKKEPMPTTGGFSFGTKSITSGSAPPGTGGFSLSTSTSSLATSDTKITGGFTFGQPTSQATEKPQQSVASSVGFSQGASTTTTSTDSNKTESSESKSIGGFKFGTGNVIGGSTPSTSITGSGIFGTSVSKPEDNSKESKPITEQSSSQNKSSTPAPIFGSGTVATTSSASGAGFSFTNKSTTSSNTTSVTVPPMFNSTAEPKKEESKPTAGLFVFGQTPKVDSTTKTSSTGGFNFKPSAESTPKPLGTGGFSFGGNTTTVASKPGEPAKPSDPGMFVFGAKKEAGVSLGKRERDSDEATSAKKGNTGSSTTGFTFGQNTSNSNATPFGGSGNTSGAAVFGGFGAPASQPSTTPNFGSAAPPAFGSSNQQPTSTTPSFGAGQPAFGASQQPSSASMFGSSSKTAATPTPSFGSSGGNSQVSSGTPAFGSSQPGTFGTTSVFGTTPNTTDQKPTAPSGGLFQFGGANNQSNNNQAAGGFSFGGSQAGTQVAPQQPAAATTGFNFSASAQPNFNFGASQPVAQPGAAFQFGGQSPAPPANPFSAAPPSSTTGAQHRKIKRAVRKIPRS